MVTNSFSFSLILITSGTSLIKAETFSFSVRVEVLFSKIIKLDILLLLKSKSELSTMVSDIVTVGYANVEKIFISMTTTAYSLALEASLKAHFGTHLIWTLWLSSRSRYVKGARPQPTRNFKSHTTKG